MYEASSNRGDAEMAARLRLRMPFLDKIMGAVRVGWGFQQLLDAGTESTEEEMRARQWVRRAKIRRSLAARRAAKLGCITDEQAAILAGRDGWKAVHDLYWKLIEEEKRFFGKPV